MSTGDPFSPDNPLSAMDSMDRTRCSDSAVPVSYLTSLACLTTASTASASSEGVPLCRFPTNTPRLFVPRIQYSIEELRHMRDNLPYVVCNLITMNSAAGDILTLPYGILANQAPPPIATSKLKHLPRGNEMRSRFDSSRTSAEVSDNEDIVSRGHPSKKPLGLSTQWQYKRVDRSQTDDAKNFQPRMAPIGVDAQKAENFRKFYRAVVSPTHVRVTAGGRIVPNSRAPAQPVFVWNKDRVAFDTVASSNDAATQLNGRNRSTSKKFQGIGSSYDSIGQTSSRSSYQKSDSSATAQSLESKDTAAQQTLAGATAHFQAVPPGVKLSHPDQFDPSKPFMVNGVMVMPLPAGFKVQPGTSVVPLSMIGNGSHQQMPYQPQQIMGAFQSSAPLFGASRIHNQHLMAGGDGPPTHSYQAPRQFPVGLQAESASKKLYHHKSTPAMSTSVQQMDRLSPKALNMRLQSYQEAVKNIDHQLTYNRHQTDENHENRKRQHLLELIAQIKDQLSTLGFAPMIPEARTSVQDRRGSANTLRPLNLSKPSDNQDSFAEPEGVYSGLSTGLKTQESFRGTVSESVLRSAAFDMARSGASSSTFPVSPAAEVNRGFVSKKRLSPSAAKAPEFKPRSQLVAELDANTAAITANDPLAIFSTPIKAILDAKVAAQPYVPITYSPEGPFSYGPDEHAHETLEEAEARLISYGEQLEGTSQSYAASAPGSGVFHEAALSVQNPTSSNVGPYLSGLPQPGSHDDTSMRGQQYSYSRPLTEAERMARALYFGHGERQHQQKGLPKFDGRDFYPASPTKPSGSISQSRTSETSTVVRKSNYSGMVSKASEESGLLQKDEETASPVTPPQRRNPTSRPTCAPASEHKKTDENKENEIITDTKGLDTWCANNGIHMPDGGTPITRSKTASLLAKLANIPSPMFSFTRDSKPASITPSERSDPYALPKLLARGASKPVSATSDEFATAKRSAPAQMGGLSSFTKLSLATPAVVDALQIPVPRGDQRRASSTSNRIVSGSAPLASVFDPAKGTFSSTRALRTVRSAKFRAKDSEADLITAAAQYLHKIAREDARRAQEIRNMERAIGDQTWVLAVNHNADLMAPIDGFRADTQSTVRGPQPGLGSMTAAQSLAAHQQSYMARPSFDPRTMTAAGIYPTALEVPAHHQSYMGSAPLPRPVSAAGNHLLGDQGLQPPWMHHQTQLQEPMQFTSPQVPYHMLPGQAFPIQTGQELHHPGQVLPGPSTEGQWVWLGSGPPQQGPPPSR